MLTHISQPVRVWVTRISGVVIGLLFLWLAAMLILAVWARPRLLAAFHPALDYQEAQPGLFFVGYEDNVEIVDGPDGRPMLSIQSVEGQVQGFLVDLRRLELGEDPVVVGMDFVFSSLGPTTFQCGFCRRDSQKRLVDLEVISAELVPFKERQIVNVQSSLIDLGRKGKRLGDFDSFVLHTVTGKPCDLWIDTIFFFDYTRSARFVRQRLPYRPAS